MDSLITKNLHDAYLNREMAWLTFARRVLALAEDETTPLMERMKFAGIMGMLYDEFAMKRLGGLCQRIAAGKLEARAPDGLSAPEELRLCREELSRQTGELSTLIEETLRPALALEGFPLYRIVELSAQERAEIDAYFRQAVLPILTPLAADLAHPFPFVSNQSLNLAVLVRDHAAGLERFVRVKLPTNRPRWVPVGRGWLPLEDLIADHVGDLFPEAAALRQFAFRVLRGAKDSPWDRPEARELSSNTPPGHLMDIVADELEARKYAGVTRLEVDASMPAEWIDWMCLRLGIDADAVAPIQGLMAPGDLGHLKAEGRPDLYDPPFEPVTHPRLRGEAAQHPEAFFAEIRRGDLLVHVPYMSFDQTVMRMLEHAALDPRVLAIKITIYRTSRDSPVVQALARAARRGKQVAVLVEITARFDEAPNIAWARYLEQEGVHVSYGVEQLKTHAKLALIVREDDDGLRRYVHFGTGNYHTGTARLYEDLGIISCEPVLGAEVAALFNELTSATPRTDYSRLLVAPRTLRSRFRNLISRETEHAAAGRPCGIRAKLNQLQDPEIIEALCVAAQAGVPIILNIRGFCSLRVGVPGLSDGIHVYSVLGRFLEHSRIYRFENDGSPELYIGSADWMKRNLDNRVEAITRVQDPAICEELDRILDIYDRDNASAWDMQPNGSYRRRTPADGEIPLRAQDEFMRLALGAIGKD